MEITEEGKAHKNDDKIKMMPRPVDDAEGKEGAFASAVAESISSFAKHGTGDSGTRTLASSTTATGVPVATFDALPPTPAAATDAATFHDMDLPAPIPRLQRTAVNNRGLGVPGAFLVQGFGGASTSTNMAPGQLTTQTEDYDSTNPATAGSTRDATPAQETLPTDVEQLLSATLVPEGEGDVVEAEPAPEGFKAIVQNKRFKYVLGAFLVVLVVVIVPTSILLPDKNGPLLCGSSFLEQSDYRGTMSTTISGKTCQRWDQQTPHTHRDLPQEKPWAGLEENYCRNPNQSPRAGCYTTDPNTAWESCDVPYCSSDPLFVFNKTCGSFENGQRQKDYRGNINITASGKTCQRWDVQKPHSHTRTVDNYPHAGLEENYCRNPDGEDAAWCYTTDELSRWEFCDVPSCEATGSLKYQTEACSNCTLSLECGLERYRQKDYRGTINITKSGKQCQRWDESNVDFPTADTMTVQSKSGFRDNMFSLHGLEENFCRNYDNKTQAWCYTSSDGSSYEYCDVPFCDDEEAFKPRRQCGSLSLFQADYRGDVSSAANGTGCNSWANSKKAKKNGHTAENFPWAGLAADHCRNPDLSQPVAFCYLKDDSIALCDVPDCKDCGTVIRKKDDYRGTKSTTTTGKTCVDWMSKLDQLDIPTDTVAARNIQLEEWGLESNFCRNFGVEGARRETTWCYVDEDSTDWEYCLVDDCEDDSDPFEGNQTCGSFEFSQANYRGPINVTASGRACQAWSSQTPHPHKFTAKDFPQAGLEGNYCRNPDGKSQAWCFTNDEEQRFEFCNVPFCEKNSQFPYFEECGTIALRQKDYRGKANSTVSGIPCQRWDSQEPHPHSFLPQVMPSAGLEANWCRNPDGSEKAWCFTTDPNVMWEYCDVEPCEAGGHY